MRHDGKIGATIQARMGSTRLPGKMLVPIMGRPVLSYMVERLSRSKSLESIVVATTTNPLDDEIEAACLRMKVPVYRGSEDDVLGRVVGAIKTHGIETHVELYGDSPLIDPEVIDHLVRVFLEGGYDCVFNGLKATYPSGLQAKVLRAQIYIEQERVLTDPKYREYTALCIRDFLDRYKVCNVEAPPEIARPDIFIELDTEEDFAVIKAIYEALYPKNPRFTTIEVLEFLNAHPEIAGLNQRVERRWIKVLSDLGQWQGEQTGGR